MRSKKKGKRKIISIFASMALGTFIGQKFFAKTDDGGELEGLRNRLSLVQKQARDLRGQLGGEAVRAHEAETRLEKLEQAYRILGTERDTLQSKVTELQSRVDGYEEHQSAEIAPSSPEEADDLQKIEGIGPKIASILEAAEVNTFIKLAGSTADNLKTIISAAGIRAADPATWPEQAAMAAAGSWDALSTLQAQLKGGRRVE